MSTAWRSRITLADTDDVGWFRTSGGDIYLVRWNTQHTGRYALALDLEPRRARLGYLPGFLPNLTPDNAIPPAQVLHALAKSGPHRECIFCHHRITDPRYALFGVGSNCAETRLGASRRLVSTLYRAHTISRLPAEGTGSLSAGTPRRHLRLVAVDGRLIA